TSSDSFRAACGYDPPCRYHGTAEPPVLALNIAKNFCRLIVGTIALDRPQAQQVRRRYSLDKAPESNQDIARIGDARSASPHEKVLSPLFYCLQHRATQSFIGLLHGLLRRFGHGREQVNTTLRTLDRQIISRDYAFLLFTAGEHANAFLAGRFWQGAGQEGSLAVLCIAADERRRKLRIAQLHPGRDLEHADHVGGGPKGIRLELGGLFGRLDRKSGQLSRCQNIGQDHCCLSLISTVRSRSST